MIKSLLVIWAVALSLPVLATGVCESRNKDTTLRHFFGAGVDLKTKTIKTLSRQFRDQTVDVFPAPDVINSAHITIPKLMEIRGAQTQFGIFPGAYRYDVINENGVAVIEVRVFLKNGTPLDKALITTRVADAENIWNMTRPKMGFEYRFRFKLVDSPKEAHFRVNVKKNTRGPYFKNWDSDGFWTAGSQAHEMGHMMGLSDEYSSHSSSRIECSLISLWCNDAGFIDDFHYYIVLRRVVMQAAGCKFDVDEHP